MDGNGAGQNQEMGAWYVTEVAPHTWAAVVLARRWPKIVSAARQRHASTQADMAPVYVITCGPFHTSL